MKNGTISWAVFVKVICCDFSNGKSTIGEIYSVFFLGGSPFFANLDGTYVLILHAAVFGPFHRMSLFHSVIGKSFSNVEGETVHFYKFQTFEIA